MEAAIAIQALQESIRRSGTRALGRRLLAPWTWSQQDTREELALNLSLLAEAFLQLLASGLGTLALVWATVVLLGGYSTALVRMDFWFTTAIVFVETARYVTNVLPSFLPYSETFFDFDLSKQQKIFFSLSRHSADSVKFRPRLEWRIFTEETMAAEIDS